MHKEQSIKSIVCFYVLDRLALATLKLQAGARPFEICISNAFVMHSSNKLLKCR